MVGKNLEYFNKYFIIKNYKEKMQVLTTQIPEVKVIFPDIFKDNRGYFFEAFNEERFNELVQDSVHFVQCNESKSSFGVVRGLHYQSGSYAQGKLVRVIKGTVLDVAVDIRKGSPTFGQYISEVLSDENHKQLWIPRGFAHGFVVLSEEAIFQYFVDAPYCKASEHGIRFDDPDIDIDWRLPREMIITSEKDKMHPLLKNADILFDYKRNYYEING